jgi:hypothetical protein
VVSQQQPKSTISAGYNLREARARDDMKRSRSVLRSMQIVKQSHDTMGLIVLPRHWVGRHVGWGHNIDDDRQGDLVRHGGEHRAALHTRSTAPASASPARVKRFQP